MEPLKPETKAQILRDRPQACSNEIKEYERLLAERFTEDPDQSNSPTVVQAAAKREQRLQQLHKTLFGA